MKTPEQGVVIAVGSPEHGNVTSGPYDLQSIKQGIAVTSVDSSAARPIGTQAVVSGVVPDGVAAIELRFADSPEQCVPVIDNVFATVNPNARHHSSPTSLEWLTTEGEVLKRVDS